MVRAAYHRGFSDGRTIGVPRQTQAEIDALVAAARMVTALNWQDRPMLTDGVYCDCAECTSLLALRAALKPFPEEAKP